MATDVEGHHTTPLHCPPYVHSKASEVLGIGTLPLCLPNEPSNWSMKELMPPLASPTNEDQATTREARPEATLYHLYHTGKCTQSCSIHTIADKDIPLPQAVDPSLPNYVDDPKLRNYKPGFCKRVFRFGQKKESKLRPVKRGDVVDRPGYDSRTETSPYFVHRPRLAFHHPPRTLRRGGSKIAPTVCLIHSSAFWRTWKLEFGEGLAREGIIDGRGVVNARYGTEKRQDGVLKGYRVRNWRLSGDTGKEFHEEQKALRELLVEARQATERGTQKPKKTDGQGKKSWRSLSRVSSNQSKHDSPPPSVPVNEEPFELTKPEETVYLNWISPISTNCRCYRFTYEGYDFYWKGTSTLKDPKFFGFTTTFNHLKLTVIIPNRSCSMEKDTQQKPHMEVCLMKFTSLAARRKSGRLEVYDRVVEWFLSEYLFKQVISSNAEQPSTTLSSSSSSSSPSLPFFSDDFQITNGVPPPTPAPTMPSDPLDKGRARFADLLMATAMCMIIGEDGKRQTLEGILSGAAGGSS